MIGAGASEASAPGLHRAGPMSEGQKSESGVLRRDLTAAVTVALVGLPQCLAYAMMSGLPPAYGLATAAVPGFVAAIAGKSPHIVTGPTNTTGLLILAALGPFLGDNGLISEAGLGALATLAIMAGLIRIFAAFAGGAALVDFIPESVLTGFTAGAGLLIAVMQLDEALGLSGVRGGGLIAEVTNVVAAVGKDGVALPAVGLTALTAAVVVVGKKVRPGFPAALVAVVVATVVSMVFGLSAADGLPVVGDRAAVPNGWPQGAWPVFDPELIGQFIGPAAAIALLGTMELAVSARRGGARPDMRREIVAQGVANVAGAFASSFPASASLTRSALLELGGAKTRIAAAGAALVVVPILFVGGPLVAALPQASLAGVLLVVATGMVKRERIKRMWVASRVTRGLLVVTFVSTLVLPLEWAIFLGVGMGVGHHLAQSRHPRLRRLRPEGQRLVPMERDETAPVVVLEVSGEVHFAAARELLSLAEEAVPHCVEHVIVDLTHARLMRFSALEALEQLDTFVKRCGGQVHLAGVSDDFARLLRDTGSKLPTTPAEPEPLRSTWRALEALPAV